MKMGDLFLLTLRVIVYIPNSHVKGRAMQAEGERESARMKIKEWGMCS